jgi:F-type H+-transporting ATPase subunit b
MKRIVFFSSIIFFTFITQTYGSEAGMPQLNPEFWAAQIFWLILIFSLLYLIIWKIFLPKITFSIENRKSRLVNDLNEAEKLKENAEKKLNEYNSIIEASHKEAKKIIDESKDKLDSDIDKKKQKLNAEIEKELKIVEKEIKELKNSSISSISKIASEISGEIINQVVNTEVNKSSVDAIVNEVLKKRQSKFI